MRITQDIARLLVQAAQQETKAKHGAHTHLVVSAWHVKIGKRVYLISLQEVAAL